MKKYLEWEDLGFAAIVEYEPDEDDGLVRGAGFRVVQLADAPDIFGRSGRYRRKNDTCTDSLEESREIAGGSVRSSGCVELRVDQFHACSPMAMESLMVALKRSLAMAAVVISGDASFDLHEDVESVGWSDRGGGRS